MFEIINETTLNNYDFNTCHNGGGYHQYEISFVIEGIKGIYRNTSCGDFGDRITILIKKEGGGYETVYLFDQVDGGVTNYSLLPLRELIELKKESGFYIPTYWIKEEGDGGIPLKDIIKEERKEVKEIIFLGQKLSIEKLFLGDYVQEIKIYKEGHTIYNNNALPWGRRWSLIPKREQKRLNVPIVGTKKTIPVKGLSEYFNKGVIYSTEW